MSFLILNRPNIEKSENIFDIFLLLYLYCKHNEGKILHRHSKDYRTFHNLEKHLIKFLSKKMKESPALKIRGEIKDRTINKYFVKGIEGRKKEEFILASLLTIDSLYTQQDKRSTEILNRNFREYGKVYFINRHSFRFGRFYKLIRGWDTIGDRIENRLNNITAVTKIATDYDVEFIELPALVDHLLRKASICVAVVPFRKDDDEPEKEIEKRSDSLHYFRVKEGINSRSLERLGKILDELHSKEVDIIVFPELTFSKDLLDHLKLFLAEKFNQNPENPTIKLVVTGSFHEDGKNKCYILTPDGEELFCQTKMNRFRFMPGECEEMDMEVIEDIDISERVFNLFDCPFGRVGTMICLDFIVPETYNLLSSLKVNCFFLPSMTPSVRRFETNAFYHACASGAVTFFSNAYNFRIKEEDGSKEEQDGRKQERKKEREKDSFIFRPIMRKKQDLPEEQDLQVQYLDRDPDAFETFLLFDSKDCKVQTVTLS